MFKHEEFTQPGSPTVEIPNRVIARYGEPTVDLDNLGQLFDEELNLNPDDVTLKFYSGHELGHIPAPGDVWRNGYRTPYTKTLRIPVWNGNDSGRTPMSRVIPLGMALENREAQAPAIRYKATELVLGGAGVIGAGVELNSWPVLTVGQIMFYGGVLNSGVLHSDAKDRSGFSWNKFDKLREQHDSDITFASQANLRYRDQIEQ